MLKLAEHRRWFDTIVVYVLQTFQFYLNDIVMTSVKTAVRDGINLTTVNLDCVILNSLKKQVQRIVVVVVNFWFASARTRNSVVGYLCHDGRSPGEWSSRLIR